MVRWARSWRARRPRVRRPRGACSGRRGRTRREAHLLAVELRLRAFRNWDQNTIPVPTPIAAAHQPGQERGGEQAEKSVQIRQVTDAHRLFNEMPPFCFSVKMMVLLSLESDCTEAWESLLKVMMDVLGA
ncbi:hypothetical protein PVAP13_7NG058417 [Panicum virgatum]|uniref:Uncharacterized protein n=1 Tax=Panicum virgatum TaxID=38727 RepID=A0A8T0PY84_PANVG|nr:hypothetical protein PVAP13_7NG058417 [Panicum virgatum]